MLLTFCFEIPCGPIYLLGIWFNVFYRKCIKEVSSVVWVLRRRLSTWDHQFSRAYFTNISNGNHFQPKGKLFDCSLWLLTFNVSLLAPSSNAYNSWKINARLNKQVLYVHRLHCLFPLWWPNFSCCSLISELGKYTLPIMTRPTHFQGPIYSSWVEQGFWVLSVGALTWVSILGSAIWICLFYWLVVPKFGP